MKKIELKKFIDLYTSTENDISELNSKYGICIWDSKNPNFYNNYNLIIHNLLLDIFGEKKVEILEDFIFNQTNLTFDQLWEILNKDETN